MSRIAGTLERLKQNGRKALVPYIVAGDPHPGLTVKTMHDLVARGADIIELGVPFSDPMAEGPVIQLAHERALEHAVSLSDAIAMVEEFRRDDADTPVLLMGYTNPIEAMGYDAFVDRASAAGVDAVLTVDLPPEEAEDFTQLLRSRNLDNIFLIAPTTSMDRAKVICSLASGFIYYVSLKGVTGAGSLDTAEVEGRLNEIRELTELPICVGFGIKDAESARTVAAVADGVVIGSALVTRLGELGSEATEVESATAFVGDIRAALG